MIRSLAMGSKWRWKRYTALFGNGNIAVVNYILRFPAHGAWPCTPDYSLLRMNLSPPIRWLIRLPLQLIQYIQNQRRSSEHPIVVDKRTLDFQDIRTKIYRLAHSPFHIQPQSRHNSIHRLAPSSPRCHHPGTVRRTPSKHPAYSAQVWTLHTWSPRCQLLANWKYRLRHQHSRILESSNSPGLIVS